MWVRPPLRNAAPECRCDTVEHRPSELLLDIRDQGCATQVRAADDEGVRLGGGSCGQGADRPTGNGGERTVFGDAEVRLAHHLNAELGVVADDVGHDRFHVRGHEMDLGRRVGTACLDQREGRGGSRDAEHRLERLDHPLLGAPSQEPDVPAHTTTSGSTSCSSDAAAANLSGLNCSALWSSSAMCSTASRLASTSTPGRSRERRCSSGSTTGFEEGTIAPIRSPRFTSPPGVSDPCRPQSPFRPSSPARRPRTGSDDGSPLRRPRRS